MDFEELVKHIKSKKKLGIADANCIKKLNYLRDEVGLSDDEIRKVVSRSPSVFTLSIDDNDKNSIGNKLNAYKKLLHISRGQVIKMFVEFPSMVNYDILSTPSESPTAVKAKLNFFKEFFEYDDSETGELLVICPQLLGVDILSDSPTSFKTKIAQMEELFGVDKRGVAKLIRSHPVMIKYDYNSITPTGVFMKVASLHTLGATNQQIVDNPYLLGVPVFDLKFRYMIFSTVFTDEEIFRNTALMVNNDKLYARFKHLSHFDKRTMRLGLRVDEKRFQKIYNVSSKDLIEEYPFNESALTEIEAKYNLTHKDKPLYFTSFEKNSMLVKSSTPKEQEMCQA